jgi:hypothetical protein
MPATGREAGGQARSHGSAPKALPSAFFLHLQLAILLPCPWYVSCRWFRNEASH